MKFQQKFFLFRDGYIDLDLDNCGGKMFLRVLLNLAMHDYKPLVSGALQLLFRHFSQRQEVLQAFKQVNRVEEEQDCNRNVHSLNLMDSFNVDFLAHQTLVWMEYYYNIVMASEVWNF